MQVSEWQKLKNIHSGLDPESIFLNSCFRGYGAEMVRELRSGVMGKWEYGLRALLKTEMAKVSG